MEHSIQIRYLENLQNEWRNLAKPEIAASIPKHTKYTNQGAQRAAIHKIYFRQLQNDLLRRLLQFFHFQLKGADLIAGSEASSTPNDCDISHPLSLQI